MVLVEASDLFLKGLNLISLLLVLFDLLGDVGGFLEAIYFFSCFIVSAVASKMFLASQIRDLYHVRIDTNRTDLNKLLLKLPSRSKSFKEEINEKKRRDTISVEKIGDNSLT